MRQILRALTFPGRSIGSLGFDRIGLVLLALAMLSLTSSSAASAALVCSNTVRNCGCAITSSGVYTLAAALASSGAGDCLSIAAKNVVLNLNGFAITGPGSGSNGSGIHVKNASSVWIEGQGAAALPPTISGWKYGIENDGNDVLI